MKKILLLSVLTLIIFISTMWLLPSTEPGNVAPHAVVGSSRLSELLSADGGEAYAKATQPRLFSFPEDHGPHPRYRNEWWYLTGNVDGDKGERFGFELTVFRFSLRPEAERAESNASEWTTSQAYIGHFAITDVDGEQFHVAQRFARDSLGLAGARSRPFRVWLEDWFIEESPMDTSTSSWHVRAAGDDIAIDLSLVPLKGPVLNGIDGLSQKSSEHGNASYYYSISRLQTAGTLRVDGNEYEVSGLSWLDREWGSSALSKEQQGWDWFALQLSDGSDLMFYHLRRNDGSQDSYSAGTWIGADGQTHHLRRDDVVIDIRDHWDSPHGGRYPAAWRIEVLPLELHLNIDPVLESQELSATVRYWEGAVDVIGQRAGAAISGRGYVELTGYAVAAQPESVASGRKQ
jgi:predicted secreted hydrolase